MKSIAIWYSGGETAVKADIHINFWKLPNKGNFKRFLDIGLKLENANRVNTILLYFPFNVKNEGLTDLGRVLVSDNGSLLTAVFNEEYKITSDFTSDYHDVQDSAGNPVFSIYTLDQENFSVQERKTGTVIEITLPPQNIRKDKTYLRFRVSCAELKDFSRIEKNTTSFFNSAFTKIEIFDFRLNSNRHLPNKILEEIGESCRFEVGKTHFFYLCSYRENFLLSNNHFSNARKLEDKIWESYIACALDKVPNETVIAYHWKEQKELSNFNVLIKSAFRVKNGWTITYYLAFLLIFALATGFAANFLYSCVTKKNGPEITSDKKLLSPDSEGPENVMKDGGGSSNPVNSDEKSLSIDNEKTESLLKDETVPSSSSNNAVDKRS